MDFFLMPTTFRLELAFDDGESQLCYEGIHNKGYNEIVPLFPHTFEPNQMSIELLSLPIAFSKDLLIQNQKNEVSIYNQKYQEEQGIRGGVSLTKYGVVHECYDFDLDYPSDLPDDYWEPDTSINIGIHRLFPSEAQVKSDLRFYNKDWIKWGSGYIHDMLAYNMVTHGGPQWEVFSSNNNWVGTIYPAEVNGL